MRFINVAGCAGRNCVVIGGCKSVVLIHGKRREHRVLRSGNYKCTRKKHIFPVFINLHIIVVVIHHRLSQDHLVLVVGFKRGGKGLIDTLCKLPIQLVSQTGFHARLYGAGFNLRRKAYVEGNFIRRTGCYAVTLGIAVLGGAVLGSKLGKIRSCLQKRYRSRVRIGVCLAAVPTHHAVGAVIHRDQQHARASHRARHIRSFRILISGQFFHRKASFAEDAEPDRLCFHIARIIATAIIIDALLIMVRAFLVFAGFALIANNKENCFFSVVIAKNVSYRRALNKYFLNFIISDNIPFTYSIIEKIREITVLIFTHFI